MPRFAIVHTALFGALALSMAACVVNPTAETTNTAAAPQESTVAAKAGEELICQDYAVTNSRVRRQKVCMTAAEWNAVNDDAKGYARSMQNNGAAQGGGDSIQGR